MKRQGAYGPGTINPRYQQQRWRRKLVSLTFSPAHAILLPMGELAIEGRLHPKFSLTALLGLGARPIVKPWAGVTRFKQENFLAWQLGLQAKGYIWGNFQGGLNLGLELLYHQDTSTRSDAQALSTGLFLGYKYIVTIGFTIDVQLGLNYQLIGEKPVNNPLQTGEGKFGMLLNLNMGWSF